MDWIVPYLLERCGDVPIYFDEVSQIVMPEWSRDRVVLLGDACQCVSLLAGQGASMAMAGAYIIAEELEKADGDVAGALKRYQARVKPDIEKKQASGRRLARWFVPGSGWELFVRDLVTRMVNWPIARWATRRTLSADSIIE
jgi:2-polyprenyl-6-methoxyphenol hydroxylase-like FAD-dependent oxidoreductase